MLKEGVFDKHPPKVVFALHVQAEMRVGEISVRAGPFMAASDFWRIEVLGKQTHGARPWNGVDPIVTSAQIVNSLQTIVSRQIDITAFPAVVTVGVLNGGVRYNIIPDSVFLEGTIRTFDPAQRDTIISRMRRTAQGIAQSAGAEAQLIVGNDPNPATINNPALYDRMLPTLQRVAGATNVHVATPSTTAEDFSYYLREVPGIFYFLGITPRDSSVDTAAKNHSPRWYLDESAMPLGVRSLANMALDYLASAPATKR